MRFGRITSLLAAAAVIGCQLAVAGSIAFAENSQPLLWYDFANGARDVSGNNLDGTVNGAAVKNGMAIFDGADDYIQMLLVIRPCTLDG